MKERIARLMPPQAEALCRMRVSWGGIRTGVPECRPLPGSSDRASLCLLQRRESFFIRSMAAMPATDSDLLCQQLRAKHLPRCSFAAGCTY